MRARTLTLSLLFAVLVFITLVKASVIAPLLAPVPPSNPADSLSVENLPAQELVGDGSITIGQAPSELEAGEAPAEATTTTVVSKAVVITYTVRRGDTLQAIANRAGKTPAELMRLNNIRDADRIYIGQVLRLGTKTAVETKPIVTYNGPDEYLLPDSEIVYSPAYKDFDIGAAARNAGGYLTSYREFVGGRTRTGPEIIQMLANEFSVGPRVLLGVLELESGWVTQDSPTLNINPYPMGYRQPGWEGLYKQTFWAAERLNAAYYLATQKQLTTLSLFDGDQIKLAPELNPGTIAVQNVIARGGTWKSFSEQITNGDFEATYRELFGAPEHYAIGELIPSDVTQPFFRLPWQDNHTWWLTGGPHNGWAEGSAWAALDFAPGPGSGSCRVSADWDVAIAPGKIISAENGRVIQDLDGDGFQGTGWVVLYMHVAAQDRVTVGTYLNTGDKVGHPSCEGGIATGTHLHIARMYNGQWIRADDPRLPFDLDGWTIEQTKSQYDGIAIKGNQRREACGCREEAMNGIQALPGLGVTASLSKGEEKNTSGVSTAIVPDASVAQPAGKPANKPAAAPASKPAVLPASQPSTKPTTGTLNSNK